MKNEIQKVFVHQITEWLTHENLRPLLTRSNKKTLAETSFDHLVRWYPQIAIDGRDSYGLDIIGRLENSMVTVKARDLLLKHCEDFLGTKLELKNRLKKVVHFEHNTPVDVVKRKLLNLDIVTNKNVHLILNDCYNIILVTKEEEKLIRKNGLAKSGEYYQRLVSIGAKLIDEVSKKDLILFIENRLKMSTKRK